MPVCTSHEEPPLIPLIDSKSQPWLCYLLTITREGGERSVKPVLELPGKVLSLLSASCVHLHMFRRLHTSSGLAHFGQEISMIQPALKLPRRIPNAFREENIFVSLFLQPALFLFSEFIPLVLPFLHRHFQTSCH